MKKYIKPEVKAKEMTLESMIAGSNLNRVNNTQGYGTPGGFANEDNGWDDEDDNTWAW